MPFTFDELNAIAHQIMANVMPTPLEIITSPGPRGSGRTYRMIMALPDRAVVVVPNAVAASRMRGEIIRLRGLPFMHSVVVYVIDDEVGVAALASMSSPIFVDHSFWENPSLLYRIGRKLEALLERQAAYPEERYSRMMLAATPPRAAARLPSPYANPPLVHTVAREPAISRTHRNPPRNRASGPQTYNGPEAEDL